ncbi:MAG: cupredoxin domain-containing protein [Burkholderiales bacterium]
MTRPSYWLSMLCLSGLLLSAPSSAQELAFTITIKDHRFDPAELTVPAGKKIKLIVKNLDPTAEEFESHDLRLEKVIPGKKEAILMVRPLKPGTYKFVGEFNEKTAQGRIVAK